MVSQEEKRKQWAARQRKAFRDGKLSKQQIDLLKKHDFEFELPDTAAENKKLLMEMAKGGFKRPSKSHPLGQFLCAYTNQNRNSYDDSFTQSLMSIRRDWLEKISWKKEEIIKLAERGASKPNDKKGVISRAYSRYTDKNKKSYDSDFVQKLKKIRPEWFLSPSEKSKIKKDELIKMAQNGDQKPNARTNELGKILPFYLNPKSPLFDKDFRIVIKKIRPDWFDNQYSNLILKKERLIEMASSGMEAPKTKTSLGETLRRLLRKSSSIYDPSFTKNIEKIRSDWIDTHITMANKYKEQLLKIAENGDCRPIKGKHPLGIRLNCYTNKASGSYDHVFCGRIKKLRKDWFRDNSSVKKNKIKILRIAEEMGERPNQKTSKLGVALSNYTYTTSKCYDSEFDAKIRALRPDWFRKTSKEKV